MGAPTATNPCVVPERFLDAASRPEAEARLRDRLPAKLKGLADSRLVGLAKEAYGYATHPGVERRHKVMAAGALLYLIAPFDAVADVIPGLGYVDDAAVLTALVVSLREACKDVVGHTQEAASEVVSHAISEAREAWARRGVSQVCLSLWAATLATGIGLLYFGVRSTLPGAETAGTALQDPFLWACMLAGAFAFVSNLAFAYRVWKRYAAAPEGTQEPLAYAIVSLTDWKQIVLLSLPVLSLIGILAVRAFLLRG